MYWNHGLSAVTGVYGIIIGSLFGPIGIVFGGVTGCAIGYVIGRERDKYGSLDDDDDDEENEKHVDVESK